MKYTLYSAVFFCLVATTSCREKSASGPAVVNRQFTLPTGNSGSNPNNPNNAVVPVNNSNTVVPSSGTATINPAHGQPGHRCDIPVGSPIPSTAAKSTSPAGPLPILANPSNPSLPTATLPVTNNPVPSSTTATGLNPAHGQPGHRCDIAVGAPLNSKPANANQPASTPAVVNKTPALTLEAPLAKGLNPAHGQPGHRCDIAVGQPLSQAKAAN